MQAFLRQLFDVEKCAKRSQVGRLQLQFEVTRLGRSIQVQVAVQLGAGAGQIGDQVLELQPLAGVFDMPAELKRRVRQSFLTEQAAQFARTGAVQFHIQCAASKGF